MTELEKVIMVLCLLFLTLPLLGNSVPVAQDRDQVGIFGGEETKAREFQWQVSLRIYHENYWQHICGGSLIHAQWVLTAAHCVELFPYEPSKYMINLREQHLYYEDKLLKVEQILINPQYYVAICGADIALLKLETPAQLSKYVKVIRLPSASQNFTADMECWVTGWGEIQRGVILPPPFSLRKLRVPVLDNVACDQAYHKGTTTSSSTKIILDDMLCAGEPDKYFCQGDSGGPLVCKVNDKWLQAGVVSMREQCGSLNLPGIYTRVTSYLDWIYEEMK